MPGLAATVKTLARSRAVWTLADQAVVSGGNFLTQLLLLRTFVREDYGLFAVGFTIVQFLLNNQAALVTTAYMVFYPKTAAEDRAAYAGSTLIHQAVLAVCGAAALCLGAIGVYLSGARPGLGVVLACQAAAILFLLFRDYARQISFAGLRVHDALAVDSVFVGVQFAGAALLAWQGQLSPGRMFLVMGAAALVAALVWRAMSRQQFSPDPARARADWSRNWRFSRWIFATSLAFLASNLAYPWVLLYFHGPAANGVLQACLLVGFQLINPFILGIGNFLAPRTAHAVHEGGVPALKAVVRKADVLFLAVVGGYFIVLLPLGQPVLDLLSKGQYPASASVLHYLAFGQLLFALTITANHALNALEQPDVAFRALLLSAAVTWTAGIWLVWHYGPLGAAAGQALGAAAAMAYTRWHYHLAVAVPQPLGGLTQP